MKKTFSDITAYSSFFNYLITIILFSSFILSSSLFISCHSSHKGSDSSYQYNRRKKKDNHIDKIHVDMTNKRGKKVVKEAMEWEGTPYKYAGADKREGTDCSGMVMAVYEKTTGVKLPRNSAKQADFCKKIDGKDLRIGDLCFFATGKDPNKISHVGIMIDDTRFIHSSTSKGVVISDITTPYYTRTFIQFGRVPE